MARVLPNKDIYNFSRGYDQGFFPSVTDTNVEWMVSKTDLIEWYTGNGTTHEPETKIRTTIKPSMLWWMYDLALYIPEYDNRPASGWYGGAPMPESCFLHTSVTYTDTFTPINNISDPTNYPVRQWTVNAGGRLEIGVFNNRVMAVNFKDATFRQWFKEEFLARLETRNGNFYQHLFLDAHAGTFDDSYGIWRNSFDVMPAITEYGGGVMGSGYGGFNDAWLADLNSFLAELRTYLAPNGHRIFVNIGEADVATGGARDTGVQQCEAAGGYMPEFVFNVTSSGGVNWWTFQSALDGCVRTHAVGGVSMFSGRWGNFFAPANAIGWNEGPEPVTAARNEMWRLAAYYIARHRESDVGATCYYDLSLPSYAWGGGAASNTSDVWDPGNPTDTAFYNLIGPALETDIGVPDETQNAGAYYIAFDGVSPIDSGLSVKVYGRIYTNGCAFVRARDDQSNPMGDSAAVSVPLPEGSWSRLLSDGTTIPVAESTFLLRPLEGAVFVKTQTEPPPEGGGGGVDSIMSMLDQNRFVPGIPKHLATNASLLVKTGPALLFNVVINAKGASGNKLTIYDGVDNTGTVIGVLDTTTALGPVSYDCLTSLGLYVELGTGTAADLTITYR